MKFNIKRKLKENKIKLIIASILFAFLILSFFFASDIERLINLDIPMFAHQTESKIIDSSDFSVNYIDVGQGNSVFIKLPDGKTMLIDGGNVEYGEKVSKFLKEKGVKKLDYMVATHADADHIAGLNYVLKEFEVKNIYRPFQIAGTGDNLASFVTYEDEDLSEFFSYLSELETDETKISRVTSNVYKNFITNIYNEFYVDNEIFYHSSVTVFYDGLKIEGENYSIEFFAPLIREGDYDLSLFSNTNGYATVGYGTSNSNDNSAIMLVNIHDYKFLFTGDSTWSSNIYEEPKGEHGELDFIHSLTDEEKLKFENISVFLLGHHGSSFSSSEELLNLINSSFFIVSVGKYNSYGHPAKDALARVSAYKKFDDYLLLTSDYGTISFGVVDNELSYSLESYEKEKEVSISWYLLGLILTIFVIYVIFSIKTKQSKYKRF